MADLKPTYEGLKGLHGQLDQGALRHLKPTYEGLKGR